MAQKNLYYKVVDKLINTFEEVGMNQVEFGDETDIDRKTRVTNYPLAHIVLTNHTILEKNNTFSFIVTFADKLDETDNKNIQYAKDNRIDIQQDLMVKMEKSVKIIEDTNQTGYDDLYIGYEVVYNVTSNAFIDYPNKLAGFIYGLDIEVPNMEDLC